MSHVIDNRVIAGQDVLDIARKLADAAEAATTQSQTDRQDAASVAPLQDVIIKLSDFNDLGIVTGRVTPEFKGATVVFRRDGSHPGARFDVVAGGRLKSVFPGCKFKVPIEGCTLFLSGLFRVGTDDARPLGQGETPSALVSTGSSDTYRGNTAPLGTPVARFTVIRDSKYDFEDVKFSVAQSPGMFLLGKIPQTANFGQMDFEAYAEDTDPTAAPILGGQTGAFEVTGWKRIRVYIDTASNGANATSFDLVPWSCYMPNGNGTQWFEQGTERISVPDTDTTGGRFRVVEIALDGGYGFMYLAIRNLLAAARTGLGFAVVGIE